MPKLNCPQAGPMDPGPRTTSGMNSLPDFLPIFRHFGQCWRQSECGGNILKHCQRILDNFLASIVAKNTSSSNFTISWAFFPVANVLPFLAMPKAIQVRENIMKHCRCILDKFLASIFCKIHFWQQFHQLLGHYFCCRRIAILGGAEGNPGVGKHFETLPMHFG